MANELIHKKKHSTESVRKELTLCLLAAVATIASFVVVIPSEQRTLVSFWNMMVTSSVVVGISLLVVYRQKFKGVFGQAYTSMAGGLLLWFMSQIIVAYYDFQVFEMPMLPTFAQFLWLSGYGFFAYFLFKMMLFFRTSFKVHTLAVVSICVGLFGIVLGQSFIGITSSQFQAGGPHTPISIFLQLVVPMMDGVLIIPAIVTLTGLKDGKLTGTPWMLLATAVLILAVADTGKAYSLQIFGVGTHWIWNTMATAGYLSIATSLFWHNKFFIFDDKKAKLAWQLSNR